MNNLIEFKQNKFEMPFQMFAKELCQRCSKLTITEVMIYSVMWDDYLFYTKERGHYTPSQADIAADACTSRKTVNATIQKLIGLGLIVEVNEYKGVASTYKVINYREVADELFDCEPVAERKRRTQEENQAKRDEYHATKVTEPVPVNTPVSVITPEPIILPIAVEEPMNEPVKASESLSIPAKKEYTVELTKNQLEMYCNHTNQDVEHVKQNLKAEPTVAGFIIELLEGLVKEEQDKLFFSDLAIKADPHFKGTTSQSSIDEDQFSPF